MPYLVVMSPTHVRRPRCDIPTLIDQARVLISRARSDFATLTVHGLTSEALDHLDQATGALIEAETIYRTDTSKRLSEEHRSKRELRNRACIYLTQKLDEIRRLMEAAKVPSDEQ